MSDCAANGRLNEALESFNPRELARLLADWELVARKDQWPPDLAPNGLPWRVWLILGGRGAGKTRAGAEWVKALALGRAQFTASPVGRIALVGETAADVRDVMIEGVSGILAVHDRRERPRWESSRRRLLWDTGAVAQAFSAEDPESLRGPQFHAAWCDELAKWRYARETWDMLQVGLRLGDWPRQLVTTTPRPTPILKELLAHPATATTRALTRENAANLAPSFLESVIAQYAGTGLGVRSSTARLSTNDATPCGRAT